MDSCVDPVEIALEQAEATVAAFHAGLFAKYRRIVMPDYDLFARGKYIKGKLLEVRRFQLAALLVVELPGNIITMKVGGHYTARLEKRVGEIVILTTKEPYGRDGRMKGKEKPARANPAGMHVGKLMDYRRFVNELSSRMHGRNGALYGGCGRTIVRSPGSSSLAEP